MDGVKPVRVQLSRSRGWKMPPNTVKVDRTTPWGSPYVVTSRLSAKRSVDLFSKLMAGYICLSAGPNPWLQDFYREMSLRHIDDLKGKNLACWCPIGAPCHADVLLRLANQGAAP